MLLQTKHFGELDIDENRVLYFEAGVPGFEDAKKFFIVEPEDKDSLFKWLQSVDKPELAFAVTNPFLIKKDYDIDINDELAELLEIENTEDVEIYSIVVVPEDLSLISMNLKAPVIINIKRNKGMQVVLDTEKYSVRHYILEELRRQEVAENACSNKEEGSVDCCK